MVDKTVKPSQVRCVVCGYDITAAGDSRHDCDLHQLVARLEKVLGTLISMQHNMTDETKTKLLTELHEDN